MKYNFSLKKCKSDIVFLCTLIITIILCGVGCGRGRNDVVYFYDGEVPINEAKLEEITPEYLDDIITKFITDSGYDYDWSMSLDELIEVDTSKLKRNDTLFLFRTPKKFNVTFDANDITYQVISSDAIYNQAYRFTVDRKDVHVYIDGQELYPDGEGIYQVIIKGDTKIVILGKQASSFIITNNLFTYTEKRIEIAYDIEFKDIKEEEIIVKYYSDETLQNEAEPIDCGKYYVVIKYLGSTYYIDDLHTTMTIERATPVVTEWPNVYPGFIGDALSTFVIEGGSANTEGTFAWARPQVIIQSDNLQQRLLFIPDNPNYQTISTLVTVDADEYQNHLQIVKEEKAILESLMQSFDFVNGNTLPKIGKYQDTIINYYSTDSLVSVDNEGYIQMIDNVEDYSYTIYAIIIYNNAAEYCEFEFEITNTPDDEVIQVVESIPQKAEEKKEIKSEVVYYVPNNTTELLQIKPDNEVIEEKLLITKNSVVKRITSISSNSLSEVIIWKIISNKDKGNDDANKSLYIHSKIQSFERRIKLCEKH